MRKFSKLVLAATIAITALAGCSTGKEAEGTGTGTPSPVVSKSPEPSNLNKDGYPIVNETIELEVMGFKSPAHGPWEEMLAFKEMEKMTNIKLKFNTPPEDGYAERKNLAFASGELPDFFFLGSLTEADQLNYGSEGLLIPLEDLIADYAPNLTQIFQQYPEIKKSITAPDGHIYALPRLQNLTLHSRFEARLYPNWELFQKNNISKMPDNTEELKQMLQQFKAAGLIPLSSANINQIRIPLLAAFGEIQNVQGIRLKDDQVQYVPMQDGYKAYLEYMNGLFADKLLDPDIFSHTVQQYNAKLAENKVAVFTTFSPHSNLKEITPAKLIEMNYPMFPVLTSPINDKKIYYLRSSVMPGNFAITNKNKHPEATMRWADYWYSLEGTFLMTQGIKVDRAWLDDPNAKLEDVRKVPEGTAPINYMQKVLTPFAGISNLNDEVQGILNSKATVKIDEFLNNQSKELIGPYAKEPFPMVMLTTQEAQDASIILRDLQTYVAEMEARFITGKEPISSWASYLKTIDNMQVDKVLKIYQTAYDRWKNSK